jgi:hypothetical protein
VVVAQEVEHTVQGQLFDFLLQPQSEAAGVLPRGLGRNQDVTEVFRFLAGLVGGKRSHVRCLVETPELPVIPPNRCVRKYAHCEAGGGHSSRQSMQKPADFIPIRPFGPLAVEQKNVG